MRFSRSNPGAEAVGPMLFSVGFLAPLIAQSLEAASLPVPFGLAPIAFGLLVAVPMGVVAAIRGRWV